jgi:hypothetical protein
MSDTTANSRSILHQGDGLKHIPVAPDVCKTPSPGGPVPVPYPNIAMSRDLADGTKSVSIDGRPAATARSSIRTSSGDEGGTAGGGLISGKIKGKLKWFRYSIDVKFEGKGVVRFLDDGMHNGNAGNILGKLNGGTYPGKAKDEDIRCDNCGKSIDDPSHVQLKQSKASDREAITAKSGNAVTAALVIKGESFIGKAGDLATPGVLTPNNFDELAKNFKTGKPIPAKGPFDTNTPGNCSEQKALVKAFRAGKLPIPVPGDGSVSLTVLNSPRRGSNDREIMESCPTCKRILTSMMCTYTKEGNDGNQR